MIAKLKIKEALLIGKLNPQINTRLELNTEYIVNQRAHSEYIFKWKHN